VPPALFAALPRAGEAVGCSVRLRCRWVPHTDYRTPSGMRHVLLGAGRTRRAASSIGPARAGYRRPIGIMSHHRPSPPRGRAAHGCAARGLAAAHRPAIGIIVDRLGFFQGLRTASRALDPLFKPIPSTAASDVSAGCRPSRAGSDQYLTCAGARTGPVGDVNGSLSTELDADPLNHRSLRRTTPCRL